MKKYLLAALAMFAGTAIAFAAGLWPDFPVVGGATYCAGSSSTATGTIIGAITGCPNQVPAGPSIVTGNEQIPADTRLAAGANPATVLLSMASLNALPITFTSGATITSVTAAATSGGACFYHTTTITAETVTLPAAPIDGQQFAICSNQTITTLTVSAGGSQTVSNAPTTLTISTVAPYNYRYVYRAGNTTWYRLQ